MKADPVKVVLVGIGGYGRIYVDALLNGGGETPYTFVGAVEPYPEKVPHVSRLVERNIPIYPTLEQFYAESNADLAILSSPIQFHCSQTCLALTQGSHVLCEKPVSATVEDALIMIAAREEAKRFVSIGYQWSHSSGIQEMKRDILSGMFGKPKRLKTIVLWPRPHKYYARGWAGKIQDNQGNLVLDSVANNATSHYIHNMFFVLGKESARPDRVTAELYRANAIENYDTAAMRAFTEDGVEILYYGSHAVDQRVGERFVYEFEDATISFDDSSKSGESKIIARFHNGETKEYENPNLGMDNKIWQAIAAAAAGDLGTLCSIEAAMSQTMAINGMQKSVSEIAEFPEELVIHGELKWNGELGPGNYVMGLVDQMLDCFYKAVLPAEAGLSWAKAGRIVPTRIPPYPPSKVIKGLEWEPADSMIRTALGVEFCSDTVKMDGSDNWPVTWADDDRLYTLYGDGYGFDPVLDEKLGLGFGYVTGNLPEIQGFNLRSNGENSGYGRNGKKGSGLLMVDGVLYAWLFHADEKGGQAQLAWSSDHAKTWTFSDWKFEEFGLCAFINYGQNYSGARDSYVYTVTHDHPKADVPADRMILMRVPKDRIGDRDAYEFFERLDGDEPVWTGDVALRGAVFEHRDACLRSGISYNSALKRYLWWQHIPNAPGHRDRGDTRFAGGFGVYDAPEPWGPWTTVYFTNQWDVGPGERAEFPTKWMSEDGRTVHLVFSGDDNFCVRKAELKI